VRAADLRSEGGFTLVEVMAAALVLVLGLLSVVASIDSSRDLVTTAERKEAAAHIGEREIESIRSLPYPSIALDAAPSSSSSENDPRFYVTSASPPTYRWNQSDTPPSYEEFVTGGGLSSAPTPWQDGRLSGSLHRFVTWVQDPCCGSQAYKRVTVAVTLNGPGYPKKPTVLSSIVRDEDPQ
jgi:type II secretory pathway pseudopilin PulG